MHARSQARLDLEVRVCCSPHIGYTQTERLVDADQIG